MFKFLFDVHQCSPVFFLLNIIYFSVCLTSNKLYWIEDQLADISTRFYTLASWGWRVDWIPKMSIWWELVEIFMLMQINCMLKPQNAHLMEKELWWELSFTVENNNNNNNNNNSNKRRQTNKATKFRQLFFKILSPMSVWLS